MADPIEEGAEEQPMNFNTTSPIRPESIASGTPTTWDGRSYPAHLRPFEDHDRDLLGLLSEIEPATFDELSVKVENPRVRARLARWLASAEWRGLIERLDPTPHQPRSYVLSERGRAQLGTSD